MTSKGILPKDNQSLEGADLRGRSHRSFKVMRKEEFNFLIVLVVLACVTFGVGMSFGYYAAMVELSETVKQASR